MIELKQIFLQIKSFEVDKKELLFEDLGIIEYGEAWNYQEKLLQHNVGLKTEARNSGENVLAKNVKTLNHFIICEHPPVFTLGKSGDISHLLINENQLKEKEIGFYKTNRGGDITFHGPQQIVGYPILDLEKFTTDIGLYLRNLEEVIIKTIAEFGIKGERSKGETGVWIEPDTQGKARKICAIGVRCSRWVTMHGFALNVNTDLSYFNMIIPCGIQNKQVTSIEKEVGLKVDFEEVKSIIKFYFNEIFETEFIY